MQSIKQFNILHKSNSVNFFRYIRGLKAMYFYDIAICIFLTTFFVGIRILAIFMVNNKLKHLCGNSINMNLI